MFWKTSSNTFVPASTVWVAMAWSPWVKCAANARLRTEIIASTGDYRARIGESQVQNAANAQNSCKSINTNELWIISGRMNQCLKEYSGHYQQLLLRLHITRL